MENQNINQEPIMTKKEHDFRNIMLTIVGVLVVLAAVSGGTFAYYVFNVSNTTGINATAAEADLSLTVTRVSTDANGPLVPQPNSTINQALVGTNNQTCIDGNGNTVCQVYQIAITNSSSAATYVAGYIKFQNGTSSSWANIYWQLLGQTGETFTKYTDASNIAYGLTSSSGTALSTTTTATPELGNVTTSTTTTAMDRFLGSTDLAIDAVKYYYIVVWLNETNSDQTSTDYGTFTGTIYFEAADGKGLTSTFTAST